jgi:hypothetical protein
MDPADLILKHYRKILPRPRKLIDFDPWVFSLTNGPQGLGDCILLSDLPFAADRPFGVHSHSTAWPAVEGLLSVGSGPYMDDWLRADVQYMTRNLGNGHLFQRLRRLYCIEVDDKPYGKLNRESPIIKNRVALHFDAGKHQTWQIKNVHPVARILYPKHLQIIQEWIDSRPDLEFVEFGGKPSGLKGVKSCVGIELGLQLRVIGTCEWFLGIVSGFMHAAAAYKCKSVVVLNFPPARKIMLPTLIDTNLIESEWLYPQNVHLHQDNAGPLVPRFSSDSLRAAFNGEVYPYFKDDWLSLIHEKNNPARAVNGFDFDSAKLEAGGINKLNRGPCNLVDSRILDRRPSTPI